MIELINLLMESRIKAHIFHLQTTSYAEHKALETFYESITELTDSIVEEYQGIFGIIFGYDIKITDNGNPLEYLKSIVEQIEKNRYTWINELETSLQNQIDEIMTLLYSTIYKLRFLK